MTEIELKQRIDELLTRVGNDRVSGLDIRTVLKEMVDYTTDNVINAELNEWEDSPTSYSTDDLIIDNDRIWKSKIDGNEGNQPPQDTGVNEDANWIEVSKGINLADWSPGLFGTGFVITFFNNKFYKLNNTTRPFESTNIVTEIAGGDWVPVLGEAEIDWDALSEETIVDPANDLFYMYDASAAANRKVKGSNLPGGGGGGSNTKHVFEFNKHLTAPQDTLVDYTKSLVESSSGVTGISYETYEPGVDSDWQAQADIAAVNTEIGTWSTNGFVRVLVTSVNSSGIDIGFVTLEET